MLRVLFRCVELKVGKEEVRAKAQMRSLPASFLVFHFYRDQFAFPVVYKSVIGPRFVLQGVTFFFFFSPPEKRGESFHFQNDG